MIYLKLQNTSNNSSLCLNVTKYADDSLLHASHVYSDSWKNKAE